MMIRSMLSVLRKYPAQHLLPALAVLAAGLLLSEINVLSARNYARVDLSQGQRFSLSQSTKDTLNHLSKDVELFVLLGAGDPLQSEARQLVQGYQAISRRLQVKYVDPDRDTVEFLSLTSKFDIGTDALTEGGVVADSAFLLVSAGKNWLIRADQLTERDADGNTRSLLEQRLTEGLAQLQEYKESRICFVVGHGEHSLDDGAPDGLLELRRRLSRSNFVTDRIAFDIPDPGEALSKCDTVAVVGPQRPWPDSHEDILIKAWERKIGLLLFLDPIVNEEGDIISAGLERLTQKLGVIVRPQFVLEADPSLRLPQGLGEAFFASPQKHPLTRGLSSEEARVDARVLIVASSPLEKSKNSTASTILLASDKASTISNLARRRAPSDRQKSGLPPALAMAYRSSQAGERSPARGVVIGSSNVAMNRSFREPTLYGNRLLVENFFSWVTQRPGLVSVPEKAALGAQLRLTEESLSDLLRYVLVFMPLTAACAGFFFLTRRKRMEEASRVRIELQE